MDLGLMSLTSKDYRRLGSQLGIDGMNVAGVLIKQYLSRQLPAYDCFLLTPPTPIPSSHLLPVTYLEGWPNKIFSTLAIHNEE